MEKQYLTIDDIVNATPETERKAVERLCTKFAGCIIYLSTLEINDRKVIRAISELKAIGESARDIKKIISARYGLSRGQVDRLLNKYYEQKTKGRV